MSDPFRPGEAWYHRLLRTYRDGCPAASGDDMPEVPCTTPTVCAGIGSCRILAQWRLDRGLLPEGTNNGAD